MALPALNTGVFTLEDAAREVLIADLAAACAEVGALVANFAITSAHARNIQLTDGRIPGQGQEHIGISSAPIASEPGVMGTRIETRLLVIRCAHIEQRLTTTGGALKAATLENESWRICNALSKACEIALLRRSGLLSSDSIFNANSRGPQRVAQDPARPAVFAVDLLIEVNMRVYDPVYMTI